MLSSSTVPVTRTATVPKKTVWANLFKNAKAGGKLAARVGGRFAGWVGLAYTLVDVYLSREGWSFSEEKGNWQRPVEKGKFIVILTKTGDGWPSLESGFVYDDAGLAKLCADKDGCEKMSISSGGSDLNKAQLNACSTIEFIVKKPSGYGQEVVQSNRVYSGDRCAYTREGDYLVSVGNYYAKAVRYSGMEELSQSQFDTIIQPHSDSNPSEFVNKSAPSENASVPGVSVDDNVTVPNGTVVTIGPYTDSDGQPKQITVTFNTQNGQTSVNVQTTPRPDLTPNSPAAPSAGSQSGSQTGSQTGNQPGSQSDTESDGKTDGGKEVYRDKDTDSKTDEKQDDKTDETPKEGSFLCNIFPDILACAKMGDVQEDEPFNIPHVNDDTTFKPDFFLPDTGQCPAPEVVNIMGQSYEFSYMWLCKFAEMIRFLVIGIAGIAAAYIMFSSLRKG